MLCRRYSTKGYRRAYCDRGISQCVFVRDEGTISHRSHLIYGPVQLLCYAPDVARITHK